MPAMRSRASQPVKTALDCQAFSRDKEIRMGRLACKTAIVTAAAAGIGRASALSLAREGAKVFATDIDGKGLARLKDESQTIETLTLDVTDAGKVAATPDRTGPVDVLVNCSDRKSTRLNSSHLGISYAVFC